MQYLAYISIGFVALQLINVLLNAIFRQRISSVSLPFNQQVSVLIPARNEEQNIGVLLDDIGQISDDSLEVIVYDDNSTDNTAVIVQKYATIDNRVRLIKSDALPNGWLGKNHACYQLAQHAKGNCFLFVDADVRLHGKIIEDAVSYIYTHKLGLLSIFPIQITKTLGEKLSVPIMNYILLTLLPLIFVRYSPFTSHAAANGQFMLFQKDAYKKYQLHKRFKNSPVEDISISRYLKKNNVKIACITGDNRIRCRMYKNYKEATFGFSKNVFMFFGNQPILAFLFWIFAALGFIPVLATYPHQFPIYLFAIIGIQVIFSLISRQNILLGIILFPIHLVFLLQVMIKSRSLTNNKHYLWKGRNIYS